jgi:hypothetical protein
MRSSGRTARAGSPPGWSPPRSMAWSTPVRWLSCTRRGTGAGILPCPLAARARYRGYPDGEHGPGLVPRSRRCGGSGLAGGQPGGLLRASGVAHPNLRDGGMRAFGRACLQGVACPTVVHAALTAAADGELSGRNGRNASDQTRKPGDRSADSRPVTPMGSTTRRYLKPVPSTTRQLPRTGSACRPAIRCRNESSPRCSGVHPAAGRVPGSPRRGRYGLRGSPRTMYQS